MTTRQSSRARPSVTTAPAPARTAGGTQRAIGNQAHLRRLSAAPRKVQRDDTPDIPLKEAKKEDAVTAGAGGVKETGTKLAGDKQVTDAVTDFAKKAALPIWNGATTADKAAMIIGGGTMVGLGAGAMLSDPNGRALLSGLPIGAPLSLVPYAIFSGFSYDLPKLKTDPLLLHLSFKGDDYLDLLRTKYPSMPKMSLSFDMTLSVSPNNKVTMPFGMVKFSPIPGVALGGGYGVATDLPNLMAPPGGGPLAPYKSLPTPAMPAPAAGAAVFFAVDFTKIDALKKYFAPIVGDVGDKR